MSIVVKKFGGTSLGDVPRIQRVAEIIAQSTHMGKKPVVVVSAMAGFTDQLTQWVRDTSPQSRCGPEYDVVLSSGEQITAGLLACALQGMGFQARSWLGWQLPIVTRKEQDEAHILSITTQQLFQNVEAGIIPIVAGFQGVDDQGRLTTLGRGGSDTTATALAAIMKADYCQIFTDVNGVYTADPFMVSDARRFLSLSYKNMLTLASYGAKVLHPRAVQWAMDHNVLVQILSTFENSFMGTWVGDAEGQKIRGAVQKAVLQGHVEASAEDQKKLYQIFEEQGLPILDWCPQGQGSLSFLTCPSYREVVAELLGAFPCVLHPCSLVTLIHQQESQEHLEEIVLKCMNKLSSANISIRQQFHAPAVSNFLVDQSDVSTAVNQLHSTLELGDVL